MPHPAFVNVEALPPAFAFVKRVGARERHAVAVEGGKVGERAVAFAAMAHVLSPWNASGANRAHPLVAARHAPTAPPSSSAASNLRTVIVQSPKTWRSRAARRAKASARVRSLVLTVIT